MSVWASIILGVAGLVITVVLKWAEFRSAVARERFTRRLQAYLEMTQSAAELLLAGSKFKNGRLNRDEYDRIEENYLVLLTKYTPLLPEPLLGSAISVIEAGHALRRAVGDKDELSSTRGKKERQKRFDALTDAVVGFPNSARRELLGKTGDIHAFERILLGIPGAREEDVEESAS